MLTKICRMIIFLWIHDQEINFLPLSSNTKKNTNTPKTNTNVPNTNTYPPHQLPLKNRLDSSSSHSIWLSLSLWEQGKQEALHIPPDVSSRDRYQRSTYFIVLILCTFDFGTESFCFLCFPSRVCLLEPWHTLEPPFVRIWCFHFGESYHKIHGQVVGTTKIPPEEGKRTGTCSSHNFLHNNTSPRELDSS